VVGTSKQFFSTGTKGMTELTGPRESGREYNKPTDGVTAK